MDKVQRLIKGINSIDNPRDIMALNRCIKNATANVRRGNQEKVFLCFNIRKGKIINQSVAMEYCRFAKDRGYLPIAPFLMFKGVFDTQIKDELEELNNIAAGYLAQCSEVWAIGDGSTRVMKNQIQQANKLGILVRYFNDDMEEQPNENVID